MIHAFAASNLVSRFDRIKGSHSPTISFYIEMERENDREKRTGFAQNSRMSEMLSERVFLFCIFLDVLLIIMSPTVFISFTCSLAFLKLWLAPHAHHITNWFIMANKSTKYFYESVKEFSHRNKENLDTFCFTHYHFHLKNVI